MLSPKEQRIVELMKRLRELNARKHEVEVELDELCSTTEMASDELVTAVFEAALS